MADHVATAETAIEAPKAKVWAAGGNWEKMLAGLKQVVEGG